MAPPTARRPASAMSNAKSSSSSTPALDAGDSMPALRKLGPGSKEAGETNIKVVVRCRGRSAREAESDDIFTPIGAQANELTIETAPATSKLGVVTPAVTRTYPFDLVFGPEADQCLVYEQVVAPMLQEVLQGYNCTLFAYGQTGSGKTFVSLPPFSTHIS
jgi:kinesin family protein 11